MADITSIKSIALQYSTFSTVVEHVRIANELHFTTVNFNLHHVIVYRCYSNYSEHNFCIWTPSPLLFVKLVLRFNVRSYEIPPFLCMSSILTWRWIDIPNVSDQMPRQQIIFVAIHLLLFFFYKQSSHLSLKSDLTRLSAISTTFAKKRREQFNSRTKNCFQ